MTCSMRGGEEVALELQQVLVQEEAKFADENFEREDSTNETLKSKKIVAQNINFT